MRNVNAAMLMAMSMGLKLEIKWIQDMAHCPAKFSDLFGPITSPGIKITEIPKKTARKEDLTKFGNLMMLREIPNSVYCEGYCTTHKKVEGFGCKPCPWDRMANEYHGKSNIVVFGCSTCTYEGSKFNNMSLLHHDMCIKGLNMYSPPAHVLDEIKAINISMDHTAGVHIRTGDKLKATSSADFRTDASVEREERSCLLRDEADIANYFAAGMRELMRMDSSIKRFVVSSDSKDVVQLLSHKFSKGVVIHHQPKGVTADCASGMALDLWSLAYTKIIIGSYTSTFGYLAAALGEPKPVIYVESCSGKLSTGRYPGEMVNNGSGWDLLATKLHTRVFCSEAKQCDGEKQGSIHSQHLKALRSVLHPDN